MPEAGTVEIGFLVTNADKAKQSIVGVGTEFTKLGATSNTASTNLKKVDTTLGTTSTKTNTLKTSAGQLNTTLGQTNPKLTQTAAEMNKMGTSAGTTSPKITKLTTDQQKLATTSAQTTTNQRNLGLGMATAATSMVNLATQVTQLGNTYDSLNDAQLAIEKGADGVKKANDRVYSTTKAYNEALKDEKQTTEDVIVKKNAMENAIETLKNKQAAQNDLIEDTNRAWKQFALQIAGTVMTSLTGVMGSITALNSAKGLKGAATGIDGVAKSSHGLKAALGPIILVIAALATAFFAIKNNTFGFRDALSDLGVKIGTAVPALKPVLEFLKQLGGFLGIAGDESATLKEKFITSITALKDQAIALFNQVVTAVQSFISQVLQIFDLLAQGDLAGAFKLIVDGIMGAWNTLNANEMVKGFIDKLIAFVTNPSSWTQLGTDIVNGILAAIVWTTDVLVPMLTTFVTSIVGFVTDVNNWKPLWDGLVQAWTDMQDWAAAIEDFITPFIDEIVAWFEDEKNWEDLWKALTEAWVAMQDWGKAIADFIKPFVDEAVKYVGDEKNWAELFKSLQEGWKAAFKWTAENIAPIVTNFFTALKDNFVPTPEQADAMAKSMVTQISDFIQTSAGALGKILYETIFGKTGTGSPEASAVVAKGAQDTVDLSLDEMIKKAEDSTAEIKVQKMVKAITDYTTQTWEGNVKGYTSWAKAIFDGLILEINKAVQARGAEINEFVDMVISFIATGFQNTVAQLQAIGNAIINYILEGIDALIGGFIKKGNEVIDNIVTGIEAHASQLGTAILKPFEAAWEGVTKWWEGAKKLLGEIGKALSDPIGYATGGGGSSGGGGMNWPNEQEDYLSRISLTRAAAETAARGEKVNPQQTPNPFIPSQAQGATLGGEDIAGLFEQGAAGGGAFASLIMEIQELITWFETLQIAIQANSTVWQAYFAALTTMILPFAELWVAFINETLVLNFQLLNVALQANSLVWAAYFLALPEMIVAFSELWVVFINETLIANITLLGIAITANSMVWAAYFLALPEMIVAFSELWMAFVNETLIANITLLNETITAHSELWGLFFLAISDMIVAFSELWMAYVNETLIANIDLLNLTITEHSELWGLFFLALTDMVVAFSELWVVFVDETIIANLELMNEAWITHQETVQQALIDIGTDLQSTVEIVDMFATFVIETTEAITEAWVNMADEVIQAVEDMVSSLEDLVSGLEDVESAANAATKALEAMAKAAAKAKSAASGVGARYGGIVSGATPRHAAKGAFINKKQRSVNGTQISEFGKWELVVPLSDPANAQDKNSLANAITAANAPATSPVNLGNMGFINRGGKGGGGGRPVIVQSNITTNLVVDGKKLASVVNPHIMTGQDAEL